MSRNEARSLLTEIIRSPLTEIEEYRWSESRRRGRRIGWDRAASEWMETQFPHWKRHHWRKAIVEALVGRCASN